MTALDEEAEGPAPLAGAVARWIEAGQPAPLGRWLERSLDPDGVPRRLAVPAWRGCLGRLAEARRGRPDDWPEYFDARIEGFFRQVLRFSRPDGSPVFGAPAGRPGARELYREWADALPDPGLATVLQWWFPTRDRQSAPPPLPAYGSPDKPLAMLRANWLKQGDALAVDHRTPGPASALELACLGRVLLGPTWTTLDADGPSTPARPRAWASNSSADWFEWSFRAGAARVIRTALLLRGRQLALLAEQVEGPAPSAAFRLALPDGVLASEVPGESGLSVVPPRGRPALRLIPLGLPCRPVVAGGGSCLGDEGGVTLRQPSPGRRAWLPLLLSWDGLRNRRPLQWRALTVTEGMATCPADVAVAYRAAWGKDESLVIYRSLARPAHRAFLGHQTNAPFLVGLFSREGKVEPIFKADP